MLKFLKNTQLRLLFSGTLFLVAFIWMAITAYDVDKEEIKVFAVMSVLFLGLLIAAGLVFSFVLFLIRRGRNRDGLLGKIESIEAETAREQPPEDRTESDKTGPD